MYIYIYVVIIIKKKETPSDRSKWHPFLAQSICPFQLTGASIVLAVPRDHLQSWLHHPPLLMFHKVSNEWDGNIIGILFKILYMCV
jgi:hypothetical protein